MILRWKSIIVIEMLFLNKKKILYILRKKLFIVFYEFILRSYFGKIVFILYYLGFILCCSYIVMDCCLDLCFVSC